MIRKFDHSELNKGAGLLWQQFKCQVIKRYVQVLMLLCDLKRFTTASNITTICSNNPPLRFILSKRNKAITLAQLMAPIILMMIAFSTSISLGLNDDSTAPGLSRNLTLRSYPSDSAQAEIYFAGWLLMI